jgi:hypothetical protein
MNPAGITVVLNMWVLELLYLMGLVVKRQVCGWWCRLVCGFIVYMAIGIAYRVTVLGVSGFEVPFFTSQIIVCSLLVWTQSVLAMTIFTSRDKVGFCQEKNLQLLIKLVLPFTSTACVKGPGNLF